MGRKTNRSRRAETATARERAAAMRAEQQAAERRRRTRWYAAGGVALAVVIAVIVVVVVNSGGSSVKEVVPSPVPTGSPDVQPTPLKVKNTTGIPGVVAYDTTGWPTTSNNGPKDQALGHNHVDGPVQYAVTPPVGGDHNATWMNCGVYDKPVPNERAVHNLEHGAVWITYDPSLPSSEVNQLRNFEKKQTVIQGSRYVDVTPYPGLPSPIVITSWGFQLQLTSPTDPRMQKFVDMFRYSKQYTPEYQGPCTGGLGTPMQD